MDIITKRPKTVIVIAVILLLILVSGKIGYELLLRTPTAAAKSAEILIPKGSGLSRIASILHKQRLIHSKKIFKTASILLGKSKSFKSGLYRITGDSSVYDLIKVLDLGKTIEVKVTLPEGLRMTDIFAILEKSKVGAKRDYSKYTEDPDFVRSLGLPNGVTSLEGFLFPETYRFTHDISTKEILTLMVKTFLKKLPVGYEKKAEKVGLSFYEAVTLASIIEKETGVPMERKAISSVFHNRMKKKMRLQTDPTVIYGIKNFNGNLTRRDLRTRTLYNTYVIKGLPPTPIANPGLASLMAAVEPESTEFLYFVAKGNGQHKFSNTYREHNKAVSQYQRRRRKNYKSY